MSDSSKTPRPHVPFDWHFVREESHVRNRDEPTSPGATPASPQPSPAAARKGFPVKSLETFAERTARIDQKLSVAQLLLRRLSPVDPRARLLSSAVFRRDEVLLDAVLAKMTDEVFALLRS